MVWHIDSLLDFKFGQQFEKGLFQCVGRSVHDSDSHGTFFFLATFRHYLFRLDEFSVALALHSFLGGSPTAFQVEYQSHNHFRFSVSCKEVGFEIYKIRRFIARSFDVYFHLWSNGVPPLGT